MSDRAPYSRIYWTVRADERLATIYGNDANFAAWTRLLIAADMAWPAPADIPASTKRSALVALEDAGVIELLPGGLFRFHGLDAERGRRKEAASTRLGTKRVPSGPQQGPERVTSRDEPSRDETSIAREGLPHLTPQVMAAWSAASGRTLLGSGQFAQDTIDDICRRHPEQAIVNAIRRSRAGFEVPPSAQQLAAAVRNTLDPLPSSVSSKQLEAEQREQSERDASRRRVESTKRRVHDMGGHAEPDPACPSCQAVVA